MVMTVSRLADRIGPRTTLTVVAVLFGTACFGMAFATGTIAFFVAFAALRALGQGSLPINATLLTAQWFVERRGRAMAIVGLGFAVSNATIPPVAQYLIANVGWREAYMALGIMVWVLVLPGAIFVVRNTPEEMGVYPDDRDRPPAGEAPRRSTGKRTRDTRPVFTSLRFWLLALPLATPSVVSTALVFHQVSIFAERGLSATVAAGVFVPYAAASAASLVISGYLADRFGPKSLFIGSMVMLLGATLMLIVIATPAAAILYAVVLGIASGAQRIVSSVTWAHIYGRHNLGRIQGSAVMVGITSAAIGPLPLAALQEATGNYTLGILLMAALPVLSIITIAFARPEQHARTVAVE
jgi:MFS family permease